MKLQIRIELILLAILLASWLSAIGTTLVMEWQQAIANTANKAEVLMGAAIAARTYTAPTQLDEIAAPSAKWKPTNSCPSAYRPTPPSNSLPASTTKFSGYDYAERVLNPTNPKDLAEG